MPNHIKNRIKFECSPEKLKQILLDLQNDEEGIGSIDFNRLIPMPKDLRIESSSRITEAISLYLSSVNPHVQYYGGPSEKITEAEMNEMLKSVKRFSYNACMSPKDIAEMLEFRSETEMLNLGRQAVSNLIRYGSTDWYEWSICNWGTKWNAYNCYFDDETMSFETAWCAPHPVILKLSERYPDITIEHEWADEDIGSNCGRRIYLDGKIEEDYYPMSRKDCIEFSLNVWRMSADDVDLVLNDTNTDYISKYSEKFDLVSFREHMMLYSNKQLTRREIPKGYHCYYIRMADNGYSFGAIESTKPEICGGTIITDEALDFDGKSCIPLNDNEGIELLGTRANFAQYSENDFEQPNDVTID